jgi:membrane protein
VATDDPPTQDAPRVERIVLGLHERFDETFVGQCVERIVELRPFERALGLASRAFIAALPLAIVTTSLTTAAREGGLAQGLIDRFGLTGRGAADVRQLFATPAEVRGGVTVIEVLVLMYSMFSLGRLLARLYEQAWRLPRSGVPGALRGALWVVAVIGYGAVLLPLREWVRHHTGFVVADVIVLGIATAVWMFTPYALLGGRIGLRSLWPTGILTALALDILALGGKLYLPHHITTSAERYGLVGVTFAVVEWLIFASIALLLAAAVGAVAGERWLRPADLDELRTAKARARPRPGRPDIGPS